MIPAEREHTDGGDPRRQPKYGKRIQVTQISIFLSQICYYKQTKAVWTTAMVCGST